MTDRPIYNLEMTDTEYAALLERGYDPTVERLLLEVGESSNTAQKLTQFAGWLQDKPPETDEEWDEFM